MVAVKDVTAAFFYAQYFGANLFFDFHFALPCQNIHVYVFEKGNVFSIFVFELFRVIASPRFQRLDTSKIDFYHERDELPDIAAAVQNKKSLRFEQNALIFL